MTTNQPDNSNPDRSLSDILAELAQRQINTEMRLDDFISTANQVLARSAVLDDVLLELRENIDRHQQNFEQHRLDMDRRLDQHQRNFEAHQRSANAAIDRLEAILVQLIQPRNGRSGE